MFNQVFSGFGILAVKTSIKFFFSLAPPERSFEYKKYTQKENMVLESYDCILCKGGIEETLEHLFLECPFAIVGWGFIGLNMAHNNIFSAIDSFKTQVDTPFFMSIIILLSWSIWISRNDLVFQGLQPTMDSCECLQKGTCIAYASS
jgi:hypothetical protein